MNIPPQSYVLVQEERLLAFATACFEKAGLDHDHAALISRLLVNSDLRGVRSHGTQVVNGYCRNFEEGYNNPRPNIRILHETQTTLIVDGDGTLGYLPMVRATEQAIAKAREVGIAMGLVRNIGHYGAAGHYTRMCMEAGCIGFSVQSWEIEKVSSPKPKLGYFGNPPLSFAIPSASESPVVFDGGSCILSDDQRGPEFEELFSKIPAAFFKSIGYGAVTRLLGWNLTGSNLPRDGTATEHWLGARTGGMVLAIYVDAVIPDALFRAETDRLVRSVREAYEPMPGNDYALLPGAIEEERLVLHRREGIRYGEMEQRNTREVSQRLGIPLPWEES